MRDKIKDREYFDEFINQEENRILKYETRLNTGTVKADRIMPVKDALLQIKLGVVVAKYSRGDSLESIKDEFNLLIDLFLESWARDSYEDNLKIASLCYLFDVDLSIKSKISEKIKERPYYDSIIDWVLYGEDGGSNTCVSFPDVYGKLNDVIKNKDVSLLREYMQEWYNNHNDSPWYDSHKNTKFKLYYGYWCFEAGAIAKRLGLDDSDLQSEQYYPYDMIHFAEAD